MNYRLIGTITATALAFASCSKQASTQTDEESTPAPKAAATPAPRPAEVAVTPATPAPATPAPATPAPAPAPELAPEGIFYLIVAARVETPNGVNGLPPGTGVKLVRPGIYLTPAGEVHLNPEQLTNDMAVARAARDAAQAAQAALRQRGAAEAGTAAVQARTNAVQNQNSNAAAILAIERQRLETQIAGLRTQLVETERQIGVLYEKKSKESFDRVAKGRTIASTTDQQIATSRTQADALRSQIVAAESELASKR